MRLRAVRYWSGVRAAPGDIAYAICNVREIDWAVCLLAMAVLGVGMLCISGLGLMVAAKVGWLTVHEAESFMLEVGIDAATVTALVGLASEGRALRRAR